jgi:hypothetical protein
MVTTLYLLITGQYECTGLRIKDVLNISIPVLGGCQQFRHGNLFYQQIFARATELHDGEITMPWHD